MLGVGHPQHGHAEGGEVTLDGLDEKLRVRGMVEPVQFSQSDLPRRKFLGPGAVTESNGDGGWGTHGVSRLGCQARGVRS